MTEGTRIAESFAALTVVLSPYYCHGCLQKQHKPIDRLRFSI